ncbi:cytochrome P450 [soil metagenome]
MKITAFNPLDPAILADPYPTYRWLQVHDPVHWGAPGDPHTEGCWYITRYADVVAALKEPRLGLEIWRVLPERQSQALSETQKPIVAMSKQWMVLRDPPAHTRLRSLVQRVFTPRMIERLTPRMEEIVQRILASVAEQGHMELLSDFALPLPVTIIAEMLGIPPADQAMFMPWSRALAAVIEFEQNEAVMAQGSQAVLELAAYLHEIIAERRRRPQEDLISALITLEDAGKRPGEDELIGTITQLLFGGNEPVVHLIGNGLLALLRHPQQLENLRGQPGLLETAIDELMRYDSSVQMTFRYALEDLTFGDKLLRQGDQMAIVMGAANRDPAQFSEPDQLDLARTPNRHMSLGVGIHYCIGGALAKAEAKAAFTGLLQHLPDLALATPEPTWRKAVAVRGVEQLPVTWTA